MTGLLSNLVAVGGVPSINEACLSFNYCLWKATGSAVCSNYLLTGFEISTCFKPCDSRTSVRILFSCERSSSRSDLNLAWTCCVACVEYFLNSNHIRIKTLRKPPPHKFSVEIANLFLLCPAIIFEGAPLRLFEFLQFFLLRLLSFFLIEPIDRGYPPSFLAPQWGFCDPGLFPSVNWL